MKNNSLYSKNNNLNSYSFYGKPAWAAELKRSQKETAVRQQTRVDAMYCGDNSTTARYRATSGLDTYKHW